MSKYKFIPDVLTEKVCGTCRHHKPDSFEDATVFDISWICMNPRADDYYLEETAYNDSCYDWEGRE